MGDEKELLLGWERDAIVRELLDAVIESREATQEFANDGSYNKFRRILRAIEQAKRL